jgi:hypothetical protein
METSYRAEQKEERRMTIKEEREVISLGGRQKRRMVGGFEELDRSQQTPSTQCGKLQQQEWREDDDPGAMIFPVPSSPLLF